MHDSRRTGTATNQNCQYVWASQQVDVDVQVPEYSSIRRFVITSRPWPQLVVDRAGFDAMR